MGTQKQAISPLTPIIAGLVMFAVILIYGTSFASYVGAQLPVGTSAVPTSSVELSPEWRLQSETIRFDGMYRNTSSKSIQDMYRD